jgi:hypothetical protein
MKQLVEQAIQALIALDAERLDQLRAELAAALETPPSPAALREALPGLRVLGALLRETERNLDLLQRTTLCRDAEDAGSHWTGWPFAQQQRQQRWPTGAAAR